jgi:uncharacterized surface protein with fasciclin (FAS1) repeats
MFLSRHLRATTLAAAAAATLLAATSVESATYAKSSPDIFETTVASGSFTTLTAALEAGGLTEILRTEGPFTVFAPTDEAFAKLPAETLQTLLAPGNRDELVALLTRHVVAARVDSTEIVAMERLQTVSGRSVGIAVIDRTVFIDGARVETADIRARNGVIHAIDTVLLPGS